MHVLTAGTPIDLVDDLPLVRLGRQRAHPLFEPIKRVVDVVGASIGLALLGPVMLWCARNIARESSGAAIFLQERVGRLHPILSVLASPLKLLGDASIYLNFRDGLLMAAQRTPDALPPASRG